jgi:hypothetical protein
LDHCTEVGLRSVNCWPSHPFAGSFRLLRISNLPLVVSEIEHIHHSQSAQTEWYCRNRRNLCRRSRSWTRQGIPPLRERVRYWYPQRRVISGSSMPKMPSRELWQSKFERT